MGVIHLKYVVSFSSQDEKYPVENIVDRAIRKPWLCSPSDKSGYLEAEFQLEKLSFIHYIDIGNCGSSTVTLLVGRSSWPKTKEYIPLLPTISMMSLCESKTGKNRTSVRMFTVDDLDNAVINEKWDRIKVICRQPYRNGLQFGLSFLHLTNKDVSNSVAVGPFTVKNFYSQNNGIDSFSPSSSLSKPQEIQDKSPFEKHLSRGQNLVKVSKSLTSKINSSPIAVEESYESSITFEEEILIFLTSFSTSSAFHHTNFSDILEQFEQSRGTSLTESETETFKTIYSNVSTHPNEEEDELLDCSGMRIADISSKADTRTNKRRGNFSEPHRKRRNKYANSSLNTDEKVLTFDIDVDDSDSTFDMLRTQVHNSELRHSKSSTVLNDEDDNDIPVHIKPKQLKTYSKNKASSEKKYHFKSIESSKVHKKLEFSSDIPDEFVQPDGSKPGTSKGITFVDCPICGDSFHTEDIELHAATCENFSLEVESSSVKESNVTHQRSSNNFNFCHKSHNSEVYIECPACGNFFGKKDACAHANICIENCLA